jgi:hypothetical protein
MMSLPVGLLIAAVMCQDVHQVAALIHECLLARMVGVDPVDLNEFSVCFARESDCFVSAGSEGSLLLMKSLLLALLLLLMMCPLLWSAIPMSPLLVLISGCPFEGLFLICILYSDVVAVSSSSTISPIIFINYCFSHNPLVGSHQWVPFSTANPVISFTRVIAIRTPTSLKGGEGVAYNSVNRGSQVRAHLACQQTLQVQ